MKLYEQLLLNMEFNIDVIGRQSIGFVRISGENFELEDSLTKCGAAFTKEISMEETEGSHVSH